MLDDIIFCAEAVFPLVILMFLGMFLKNQKKIVANPKDFFTHAEKFVFTFALPVFVFNEISQSEVGAIFNAALVLYCVAGIIVLCLLLSVVTSVFIKDKKSRGAFIQGIFRSNFAILGVPLAGNLFGDTGSATAALILPFIIVLYNSLAVIILTVNSDNSDNLDNSDESDNLDNSENRRKSSIKKIMTEIIKNPLIIAIFIGLPFMLFNLELPVILQKSVTYVSNMSTPLALLSLGAGVDLLVLKAKIKLSLTAALIKTVLSPAVFVIPAVLLGFRDEALTVIFVLFAAPTAVSSYIMAKNMRNDAELAAQILGLTTLICPVTIFTGSFILKTAGVI
jgi:predicted permease